MTYRKPFITMSRTTRTRLLSLGALVAGVLFFWVARQIRPAVAAPRGVQTGADLTESVVRLIRADYVEEPNAKATMEGGFRGLANSLDALSSYLDKDAARKSADAALSGYKDIGLIVFKRASTFPVVVGLVEGSPAEKAGLKTGDVVSALDDASTILPSLPEIRLALKASEAKPVKVRIIRDNETKEISVVRGDVYPKPFAFTEQAGTSGVLAVAHFHPPLVDELKANLLPRLAGKTRPLILDLRFAYEGDNAEALRFVNLFVQTAKAGQFEKKGGVKETLACPDPAPLGNLPIVLWIAPSTMGPAEIAAACLRDLRQAKAVGTLTPGLTARQDVFALPGGDALLLTTGIFLTASGEKIWSKGIVPDVKIDAGRSDRKAYLEKSSALLTPRS
ncbi:MAG: S41 family peptidase [Acidobacteriota bacterium]|nr:S41 family peptidase [Acidobacteriota bacterium]